MAIDQPTLTEGDLRELEMSHHAIGGTVDGTDIRVEACWGCSMDAGRVFRAYPCSIALLIAEIRRLKHQPRDEPPAGAE